MLLHNGFVTPCKVKYVFTTSVLVFLAFCYSRCQRK